MIGAVEIVFYIIVVGIIVAIVNFSIKFIIDTFFPTNE
jgi:hypothetical protein